jgi:hypothetical protein
MPALEAHLFRDILFFAAAIDRPCYRNARKFRSSPARRSGRSSLPRRRRTNGSFAVFLPVLASWKTVTGSAYCNLIPYWPRASIRRVSRAQLP